MNRQNLNNIEKEIEKKYKKREKEKRRRMKVSGGGIKGLQKIIINKLKTQNSKRKTTT